MSTTTPSRWSPGDAIIHGVGHRPPDGVTIINFKEVGGVPTATKNVSPRKRPATQFVLHRGAELVRLGENYAQATERVLDARSLSTTFSLDTSGTVFQHFDPGPSRGRHATWHNDADSLDVGGPFSLRHEPVVGQQATSFRAAIGREGDGVAPLARKYAPVRCWSLTPAQVRALALFLPWWCSLRSIPLTACDDLRTFRIGGKGLADPVTNVRGILAHGQISGPGQRVDGFLELLAVRESGLAPTIEWRPGTEFFST